MVLWKTRDLVMRLGWVVFLGALAASVFAQPAFITLTDFNEGIGSENWEITPSNGARIETDSNRFRAPSNNGLRFVSENSSKAVAVLSADMDLSGFDSFYLEYYSDENSVAAVSDVWIEFSNNDFQDFFRCRFMNQTINFRHSRLFQMLSFNRCKPNGNPSWKKIDHVRVTVSSKPQTSLHVTFDRLSAYKNQLQKGKVLFTFDDGSVDSFVYAKPKMDEYGFAGTAYVIMEGKSEIGRNKAKFSIAEVQALYDAGWDISSHGYEVLSDIPIENAVKSVKTAIDRIDSNGWTRASHHYAYPSGRYSGELIEALKTRLNIQTIRTTMNSPNTLPLANRFTINAFIVRNIDSAADLEQAVSTCADQKQVCIFSFHLLVDEPPDELIEFPKTEFFRFVDFVGQLKNQNQVDVITISELYNLDAALNAEKIMLPEDGSNAIGLQPDKSTIPIPIRLIGKSPDYSIESKLVNQDVNVVLDLNVSDCNQVKKIELLEGPLKNPSEIESEKLSCISRSVLRIDSLEVKTGLQQLKLNGVNGPIMDSNESIPVLDSPVEDFIPIWILGSAVGIGVLGILVFFKWKRIKHGSKE